MRQAPLSSASLAAATTGVSSGQRSGGCEIRTREGLHPTRFPSVRLGVHGRPCSFVTWGDRDRWVSSDARESRRMRLRMRLQPKAGRLPPASSAGELLLGLTCGELARQAGHAAPRRRSASCYVERRHHTERSRSSERMRAEPPLPVSAGDASGPPRLLQPYLPWVGACLIRSLSPDSCRERIMLGGKGAERAVGCAVSG